VSPVNVWVRYLERSVTAPQSYVAAPVIPYSAQANRSIQARSFIVGQLGVGSTPILVGALSAA
jgi:hypothetical protein